MKIKTIKSIAGVSLIAILGALVSISGIAKQAEDPAVLLRAAIEKEEVDGDLQGAIDLYKQIVAKYADNRAIAAKALLRLGGCYEKLGLREAQSAYQRVIEDYPQQLEEVRAARERISRLAKASAETLGKPTFRKIQIPANPGNGVLSPDGKRLAFASEGSIWVVPIPGNVDPNIAGTPVRLTDPIGAYNVENSLAWSGDGKWIAFNTSASDSLADPNSIFIVSSTGGPVKKMPIQPEGIPRQRRLSLSPDGKTLVFHQGRGIYTLSVDSGEGKVLIETKWGDPAFSPDGARLAYIDNVRTGEEYQFSLWVADLGGNSPVKISEMSGLMRGPTWSPDGTMIAVIHDPYTDQVNDRKICIIPVGDPATASNNPLVIELPLEPDAIPAGWTSQNSIGVMLRNPPFAAIYTVPSSGGRATQVSPAGQTITHPRWSPDGRRIFYRGLGIFSIPWDGGAVATVLARANRGELYEATSGGGNNVSPDGKKLVFSGAINIPNRGDQPSHVEVNIYTIPVGGGQPTQITAFPWDPKNSWAGQARFPCWSPDGKRIAFIRDHINGKGNHVIDIFTAPSSGGAPQQITSESDRVEWAGIDWSPDGRQIAYYSQDKTINLFPIEGGASKTLIKVEDIDGHSELSWSPDGKKIAFSGKGKIYTVPVEGGQPVEVKTGLEAEASNLAWSPDGKTIAFAATKSEPAELYLMEDFLPRPAAAKKAPQGLTIRKVYEGGGSSVSPDGRYVSFADEHNLAIRDLTTAKTRRLTNAGSIESRVFADHSQFSPDGRQIAYEWFNGDETWDLRLIGLDGSGGRVLLHRDNGDDIYPCGWSPDGKRILVGFFRMASPGSLTGEIAFVSVADGTEEVIKPTHDTNFSMIRGMNLSPDGRYIAYHAAAAGGSKQNDLYLLSSDGSRDAPLFEHPANDRFPVWTPDGQRILFISDRAGAPGFWMIDIVDGKPRGEPRLVKPDIGDIGKGLGFTRQGAYYYAMSVSIGDVHLADLNPATGKIQGKPGVLASRFANKLEPVWSPDGQHLAFFRRTGPDSWAPGWRTIFIRNNQTGKERELANNLILSGWVRWFPDGRSLLVSAMRGEKDFRVDYYRVDIETGNVSLLLQRKDGAGTFWPGLSPDGKTVFFTYYKREPGDKYREPGDCFLGSYQIETRQEKELCHILPRGQRERQSIAVSPDGRQLAFVVHELPWPITSVIKVISPEGGEPRELFRSPWPGYIRGNQGLEWTPDGRYLLVVRGSMSTEIGELLRIPVQGGEAQKVGLAAKKLASPSIRPAGKQLAFHAVSEASNEIWVMENFLTKSASER